MIDEMLIFEVHYSNINRYVNPFAKHLLDSGTSKEVVILYDSFVEKEKIQQLSILGLRYEEASTFYKSAKNSSPRNRAFYNYSFRIADLYWTYKFKKIGAICYQQQHGMYADFLERSLTGYFSTLNRKVVYFKYLLHFFFSFRWTIALYLLNKDFFKSKAINKKVANRSYKLGPVQSDHLFVWGDYWKEWFRDNHFYDDLEPFTTIGNPDYHKFIVGSETTFQPDQVCYIAQTFVEDGRMERQAYKKIVDRLAVEFKSNLIIKLHPRSDRDIFQEVLKNGGSLTYDFPFSGTYLGHYSSLLALAINMKSRVFLLEINNEEIPTYFSNSANKVFTSIIEMVAAVKNDDQSKAKKEISFYFENKQEHPFELICNRIIKDFENGNI
ncbi:MAG: hypothetical protein CMH48_05710 [Muricauda sp.]|nr:hypothetical protein [Allomuricauda sp.]MBC30322.1 hypothetical protein [Allomuricauda sp.]